jgi:thiamine-monophosphate kinase
MPESSPALSEFDLIRRYFTRPVHKAALGVGDDCALIEARPGHQLAISTDMLVSGRHFFPDVSPRAGPQGPGREPVRSGGNGRRTRAFTLALALPEADAGWLAEFAAGMLALADDHGCELIGGDTTKGPLTLSITVFGDVPRVRRCGATRRAPATISGSPARSGMRAWPWATAAANGCCPSPTSH